MKKFSIVVSLFLIFAPLSALAIQYCVDFLEYENPGGWENSLKTCDQDIAGNWSYYTYLIDVWINDVPEPLITAGFWIVYSYYNNFLSILEVQAYDGVNGPPGPWDPSLTAIFDEPSGPGTYFITTGNLADHAHPDAGGDIIIAQIKISCDLYGYGSFTISTIPYFDTVIGESSINYDPNITPITLPLNCHGGVDYDGDRLVDWMDNCYRKPNGPGRGSCTWGSIGSSCMLHMDCGTNGYCSLNQEDTDSDNLGDACDDDDDNDQVFDVLDNCPLIQNGPTRGTCYTWSGMSTACTSDNDCGGLQGSCSTDQEDLDTDTVGGICDNCPEIYNPYQIDSDGDCMGDECDPLPHEYDISQLDSDGDGIGDTCDPCTDVDEDGYSDSGFSYACALDNCPEYYNPTQEDYYPPQGNGIGDACDCEGNFNCDTDTDVDGSDAATFKQSFGRSPVSNPCTTESPCHGDFNCDHDCDGTDAARFKQDFGRSAFSNPCPSCVVADWCGY